MDTRRDVEEALTIFDQLTEENQHIALDRLWGISLCICECEQEVI